MRTVCIASSKEGKKEHDYIIARLILSGFELESYSETDLTLNAILRYQEGTGVVVPDLTSLIQQGSLINFY